MKRIYLDHAATTPLRPEVLEVMLPWMSEGYGNPSSLHKEGKQARQALDIAREKVASLIGAKPIDIIFTSGGTEANNTIITGVTSAVRQKKGRERGGNHAVCSALEHHAVLEPMQALKRDGYEVSLVKPTRSGFIEPAALENALRRDTVFASIMMAQNEIGTIQPIEVLVGIAHASGVLFHTDAVQALGKVALNVSNIGVDAASFSAHKLGGPKGVGVIYLKRSTPFVATLLGGGQELKRRSGTQNVAGAVGFAAALELAEQEREAQQQKLAVLRNHLATGLLALSERISLCVDIGDKPEAHLPHILSFFVAGFESETLILKLDDAGFALSGGSACSTGSLEASHVLTALKISRDLAYSMLRVSLGHASTKNDIDDFLSALKTIIKGKDSHV